MSDTSHKEIGPAKYEREGKEEKLKSTPKEEEGILKEHRNNVYNLQED